MNERSTVTLPGQPRTLLIEDHRRLDVLLASLNIERRINDIFAAHGDQWRLDSLRREIMRAINDELRTLKGNSP